MMEKNPVGEKIRIQRERLGLSLDELAQKSQCSVSLLERLEAGALVPSLTPLLNIARALGVRLGTFLDDSQEFGPVVARKKNCHEDRVVRFSGSIAETNDEKKSALDFAPLASDKVDRHMEPFLIDVRPTTGTAEPSSHEGEEFLYVLEGELEINYGQETYLLQTGDSIYYDSIVPHHVHAPAGGYARILAVVYAPF
ncbi:MAG: XRE family transcriptional regulator [Planctomycetia bacterium]|nr:XRE family transcriptional regulator [Planctomycetia bacterium]